MKQARIWTEWSHDDAIEMIQNPEWMMVDDSGCNFWNIQSGQLLKIEHNQFGKFIPEKAFVYSPDRSLNGFI